MTVLSLCQVMLPIPLLDSFASVYVQREAKRAQRRAACYVHDYHTCL